MVAGVVLAGRCSRWIVVAAFAGLTGCATPGPLLSRDVGTVRAGLAATRDEAAASFDAANGFVRDQAVERKLASPGITLAEADFPPAVSREDAARWTTAFAVLDRYAAALQQLVDPKLAQASGDALVAIGTELKTGSLQAKLPGGVVGVFAGLGEAIVAARAEKHATAIMRQVDPAFTAVTAAMADAVGADDGSGLRGTVHASFEADLGSIRSAYAVLPAADRAGHLAVIIRFRASLDRRDAAAAEFAQLHDALLALGAAHAAAARGNSGDALFWIARIDGWLDDVHRRAAVVAAARGTRS